MSLAKREAWSKCTTSQDYGIVPLGLPKAGAADRTLKGRFAPVPVFG